jgi:hypothetical protein
MTGSQAERVRAQFGGSAPAHVTSPGHAGGEDPDRLVDWGRAMADAEPKKERQPDDTSARVIALSSRV